MTATPCVRPPDVQEVEITFPDGDKVWDIGERQDLDRVVLEALRARLPGRDVEAFSMILGGLSGHSSVVASATTTIRFSALV